MATKPKKAAELLASLATLIATDFGGDAIALKRLQDLKMRLGTLEPAVRKKKAAEVQLSSFLPKKAPKLWLERKNKDESPVDFIRRVYAPWLGKGLGKPHIRQLDMSLYEALRKWPQNNERPTDLYLPTKSEIIDKRVADAGGAIRLIYSPELRAANALYSAVRRRRK